MSFSRPLVAVALAGVSASAPMAEIPSTRESAASCCAVLELRQYTLRPGQRDTLIELFEREFVESQEAVGMRLVGQFRDLERPDRFVWIRGFPDMPARAQALDAFYGGPIWKAHREAANATMIDSDNVLLLRPIDANSAFAAAGATRSAVGAGAASESRIVATIHSLDHTIDDDFRQFFATHVEPAQIEAGALSIARLETESAANTFPRLPVREGEHVFISFAEFTDARALADYDAALAASPRWMHQVLPVLTKRLKSPPERLVLQPTPRSQLR
ncbi:MAG: NIPSNAP family protein [Rhodanobacteraceae bacterium]